MELCVPSETPRAFLQVKNQASFSLGERREELRMLCILRPLVIFLLSFFKPFLSILLFRISVSIFNVQM